jgi:hypothetical protein
LPIQRLLNAPRGFGVDLPRGKKASADQAKAKTKEGRKIDH